MLLSVNLLCEAEWCPNLPPAAFKPLIRSKQPGSSGLPALLSLNIAITPG
jgi:hypothetical protein